MSACEKYVTDDVIIIGREKTFGRRARQTDKHCAPREAIPCLLLNQFSTFLFLYSQSYNTSVYHASIFFSSTILAEAPVGAICNAEKSVDAHLNLW